MSKLGIIAAKGDLVKKLIQHVSVNSIDSFIVAIEGETPPSIVENLEHIWISLGEIGKAINALKAAQVERVVFIGSLTKPDLFSLKLDVAGTKLLAKIVKNKFFGDNNLLSTLTVFLEDHGFKIIGIHEILKNLVVKANNFTNLTPSEQDRIDIELAIKVVKELGKLDIGQAVIVENGVILGVEAIEGTDKLIQRCAALKLSRQPSGVLVKFSKPAQELRIDLPTIGLETIKNMHLAGFKGIAIEANRSIFLDQEQVIEYANKHNMFMSAI
jgi:DUF1009 family protein